MAIKKGSMREAINSVYQILINDEELLRLLWYKPKDRYNPDPLDESLPNVMALAEYWDIVDNRIMLTNKVSDLEGNKLCRLYVSSGRRKADGGNYLLANQEIIIAAYVHEAYQSDLRSESITDRLNELLSLERMDGVIGKLDFVKSDPYNAPLQYQCFVHRFVYTTGKK